MINYLKVFFIVFIKIIIFLIVFGFSISINSDGIIILPILLLSFYLLFYFKYSNKVYTQMKLDKNLFNLYYFISWIIIGILITYLILTESWLWNFLPKNTGMFSGLEYILVPLLLCIYLVILVIGKFISFLYLKK